MEGPRTSLLISQTCGVHKKEGVGDAQRFMLSAREAPSDGSGRYATHPIAKAAGAS